MRGRKNEKRTNKQDKVHPQKRTNEERSSVKKVAKKEYQTKNNSINV